MKPTPSLLAGIIAVALAGCHGSTAAVAPAPAAPEVTVAEFLAAVNANDLGRMGQLWGDERGPSTVSSPNSPAVQRQQLEIMQRLLAADEHHVTGTEVVAGEHQRRRLQVELVRGARRATVPFVLVEARTGGWVINTIGIDAAMPLSVGPIR